MSCEAAVIINRRDFDATIFDLDGVLTDTARVHAAAWKRVFDDVLQRRAERQGIDFQPFRYRSRLSFICRWANTATTELVHFLQRGAWSFAIADRKTRLFRRKLEQGIDPAPGALALLTRLRQAGIGIAVASSSKNCAPILHAARIDHLIDARVDGIDAAELGLQTAREPEISLVDRWRGASIFSRPGPPPGAAAVVQKLGWSLEKPAIFSHFWESFSPAGIEVNWPSLTTTGGCHGQNGPKTLHNHGCGGVWR